MRRSLAARLICAGATLLCLAPPSQAQACPVIAALETFVETSRAPDAAACRTFLSVSGAVGASCQWTFPLRDAAALRKADELWTTLTECRAGSPAPPDAIVNHPDSYDLREWRGEDAVYRVSVKDKLGLNQTFVFLRWARD